MAKPTGNSVQRMSLVGQERNSPAYAFNVRLAPDSGLIADTSGAQNR